MNAAALNEVVKTQRIRLLDVFVIGPLMMAGGAALERQGSRAGGLLVLFGITTVFYNARNWHRVNRKML